MKRILVAAIALVLPGTSIAQQVGHELLDASGGRPIVVWGNTEITTVEYDALVLPSGWLRNEPREGVGQTPISWPPLFRPYRPAASWC